jgi:hypothetical protein
MDESHSSGELVSFKDPAGPSLISITANKSIGMSLDAFVSASQVDLSAQQQVPLQQVSQKPVTLGGRDGRELLYTGSLMGIDIKDKMDFILDGNTGYVFFLTSGGGSFAANEILYDASLKTVAFTSDPVRDAGQNPGANLGSSLPAAPVITGFPVPGQTGVSVSIPESPVTPAASQQASAVTSGTGGPQAGPTRASLPDPAIIIFGIMVLGVLMRSARRQ